MFGINGVESRTAQVLTEAALFLIPISAQSEAIAISGHLPSPLRAANLAKERKPLLPRFDRPNQFVVNQLIWLGKMGLQIKRGLRSAGYSRTITWHVSWTKVDQSDFYSLSAIDPQLANEVKEIAIKEGKHFRDVLRSAV